MGPTLVTTHRTHPAGMLTTPKGPTFVKNNGQSGARSGDHTQGIDLNIEIGIFSYAMLVLYVAWIAPATAQQLPDTIKHATTRLRARLRRGPQPQAAPPPPTPAAEPDQLIHT